MILVAHTRMHVFFKLLLMDVLKVLMSLQIVGLLEFAFCNKIVYNTENIPKIASIMQLSVQQLIFIVNLL